MKANLILFIALFFILECQAIEVKSGENVVISSPVHEDLYITGGTVVINAPIHGDLIVVGGTVTVNDTVSFDVMVMGGEIFLNSYVGDDVRVGGGRIHVSGRVEGDLLVGGGNIAINHDAYINGSVLMGAGDVIIDGTIAGQLKAGVGKLVLNGIVQKDVDCRGGELVIDGKVFGKSTLAATTIEIGEGAEFHQDIRYWNNSGSLDFKSSIRVIYDQGLEVESGRWQYLGFVSILALFWYLGSALVMIFIIQYLFRDTLKKAAATVLAESLKSLGFGFLFVVAVPVAVVISFVTLIGIPVGIILLSGYFIAFMLATSITSVVISNWINNVYYSGSWKNRRLSFMAFLIFIVMKLFSLTPFIGFAITALMVCMAWGAILLNVKWKISQETISPHQA